jgi:ribosomal protein L24E
VIAFEISINGTVYTQTDEITAVTLVAELVNRRNSDRVSLHALSADGKLQWLDAHLAIGDEIRVRLIDAADVISTGPEGCSFCGREVADVRNLIQSLKTSICDSCTRLFADYIRSGERLPLGASIRDQAAACGFCGRAAEETGGVVVRNAAAICPECIHACEDIVEEAR